MLKNYNHIPPQSYVYLVLGLQTSGVIFSLHQKPSWQAEGELPFTPNYYCKLKLVRLVLFLCSICCKSVSTKFLADYRMEIQ